MAYTAGADVATDRLCAQRQTGLSISGISSSASPASGGMRNRQFVLVPEATGGPTLTDMGASFGIATGGALTL